MYNDIYSYIGNYLEDIDKANLTAVSVATNSLKYVFVFRTLVPTERILHLSYYDSFENVELSEKDTKIPRRAKSVHYSAKDLPIPSHITHLTFSDQFDESIDNKLPSSVTHLVFGIHFNKLIKCCLPKSITHLSFCVYFDQPIAGCLPDSLICLKLGFFFNQPIKGNIPPSVTHLSLGPHFARFEEDCIPATVTHLCFFCLYPDHINNVIPQSVTHIIISRLSNDVVLPLSLTHLTVTGHFSYPGSQLPPSLISLTLHPKYQHQLQNINPTIKIEERQPTYW